MKFVNRHNHPVTLVDGREVGALGEADLSKEQYEDSEQWRMLPDLLVGGSPAADKLIAEAEDNPTKFDNQAEPKGEAADTGGTT